MEANKLDKVNAWCAEKLNGSVHDGLSPDTITAIFPNKPIGEYKDALDMVEDSRVFKEWTISDPRCRELVRERFKLSTLIYDNGECVSFQMPYDLTKAKEDYKNTIAEAEIACIVSIYDSEVK